MELISFLGLLIFIALFWPFILIVEVSNKVTPDKHDFLVKTTGIVILGVYWFIGLIKLIEWIV